MRPHAASCVAGAMHKAALALCMVLCSTCPPAHAQPAAHKLTPPPGWSRSVQDEMITFKPAEPGAVLTVWPVLPYSGNLDRDFAQVRSVVEQTLGLRNPNFDIPPKTAAMAGVPTGVLSGRYDSAQGPRWVSMFVRGEQQALGIMVFLATTAQAKDQYQPSAFMAFAGWRLTPEATRAAAARGGASNAAAAPQAPAAEPPAVAATTSNLAPVSAPGAAPTHIGRTLTSVQELAGIWSAETSKVSYRTSLGGLNQYGAPTLNLIDSAGKGWGGMVLKVGPDGRYSFHYDYAYQGCHLFRDHEGSLALGNGVLTMNIARFLERQEKTAANARQCEPYQNRTAPPTAYRIEVGEVRTVYGYPTYRITLVNALQDDRNPMMLDRLDPLPRPLAQPTPRGFAVGNASAGGDLQGLWVAEDISASTQNLRPEQRYRAELRLMPGGAYEFRAQRPDALHSPLCTKNLVLTEQGTARFALRLELGGTQEGGTLVLQPTASQLSEEVTQCGTDDHRRTVQQPLAPRYFSPFFVRMKNTVNGARDATDTVGIRCPAPQEQGAWQYLFCDDVAMVDGYHRR